MTQFDASVLGKPLQLVAADHPASQPSSSSGISCMEFARNNSLVAIGGWGDRLCLVSPAKQNALVASVPMSHPVLDLAWLGDSASTLFAVGLRPATIQMIDTATASVTRSLTSSRCTGPVKSVIYSPVSRQVITGSWDAHLTFHDPSSSTPVISALKLPQKIFSMDIVDEKLVVVMSNRLVHIYDVRDMSEPLQMRENSLKYMSRIVRCMPNGQGYVCGSIEGRVAVEYFNPDPKIQADKYAFKCHRKVVDGGIDTIFPVNAIAFHPIHGTFATGGSDGTVNVWDARNKKRLRQYATFPTGISALCFNSTGDSLAIASSYSWEEGEKEHPPDQVFLKEISETECRPKTRV